MASAIRSRYAEEEKKRNYTQKINLIQKLYKLIKIRKTNKKIHHSCNTVIRGKNIFITITSKPLLPYIVFPSHF